MKEFKFLVLAALGAAFLTVAAPASKAQVSVSIGPAPVCPYGYYDYAPYACAPYGYYGPTWFANGVFIGAGPWFHGPDHFYGHVDNHFDPRNGYKGPMPQRGERASRPVGRDSDFKGNEVRDGHGHTGGKH